MLVLINATKICKKKEHQFVVFLTTLLTSLINKHKTISIKTITLNDNIEINSANYTNENIVANQKQHILTKGINTIKINRAINKSNYDLIISINTINQSAKKRQICLFTPLATQLKLNNKYVNPSTDFIIFSELDKAHLPHSVEKLNCIIHQVNPYSILANISLSFEEAMQIKDGYADGREYFLYDGNSADTNDIIDILKSFSIFKKWQSSSMKLLILLDDLKARSLLQTKIENYKYKDDVVLIADKSNDIISKLIIATYCFIAYSSNTQFPVLISYAIKNKISVICSDDNFYREHFQDTIMYAEKKNINSLADKMKAIYRDENLKKDLQTLGYEKLKHHNREQIIENFEKIIFRNTN